MYSVYYGLAPKPICDLFPELRRYHLRRAEGFNVPKYNYSIGRTSLSYRGPIAWNILPESHKLIDSWASFKQKIKKDPALLDKSFLISGCRTSLKNAFEQNHDRFQGLGLREKVYVADWGDKSPILVPIALFSSLSRRSLGTREMRKGLWERECLFSPPMTQTEVMYLCGRLLLC